MSIFAIVGENNIGRDHFQLFENCFHFHTNPGHETVAELMQMRPTKFCAGKHVCRLACLAFPYPERIENNPMKLAVGILLGQTQNCTTASDFNVIGMTTET